LKPDYNKAGRLAPDPGREVCLMRTSLFQGGSVRMVAFACQGIFR